MVLAKQNFGANETSDNQRSTDFYRLVFLKLKLNTS